jgi:hypothetical protein
MVSKKTKKQNEIDKQQLEEAYKKLHKKAGKFVKELFDVEFDVRYISIGTVTDLLNAVSITDGSQARIKEEYVCTNYDSDFKHKEWNNSTHIGRYEEK